MWKKEKVRRMRRRERAEYGKERREQIELGRKRNSIEQVKEEVEGGGLLN